METEDNNIVFLVLHKTKLRLGRPVSIFWTWASFMGTLHAFPIRGWLGAIWLATIEVTEEEAGVQSKNSEVIDGLSPLHVLFWSVRQDSENRASEVLVLPHSERLKAAIKPWLSNTRG